MSPIDVPKSALLADLDETLRRLLGSRLALHGWSSATISFDLPDRAWQAAAPLPAVNVFLYDVREAANRRLAEWTVTRDGTGMTAPPLRLEASYAITAWAEDAVDEHRLLSQVITVLHANRALPEDVLAGELGDGSQLLPIETAVARADDDALARLWSLLAIPKPAVLYSIVTSVHGGPRRERGPAVRGVVATVEERADGD
jgi:Pvc16 N-terminal domain